MTESDANDVQKRAGDADAVDPKRVKVEGASGPADTADVEKGAGAQDDAGDGAVDGGDASAAPKEERDPVERAKEFAEAHKVTVPANLDRPTPPAPGTGLPKHQHKFLLSAIKAIKRLKDGGPFVAPVDPVKQGVPRYFDFIKHPMDLGTMDKKLMENKYDTVQQVVDDFNLIVSNCIVFNGEDTFIAKMALNIAQSFTKHLNNMPGPVEAETKPKRRTSGAAASATTSAASAASTVSAAAPAAASTKQMQAPGVPVLRRDSAPDGRPKREIHPPKNRDLPYGMEHRPRNKKLAAELRFCGQLLKELMSRKHENIAWPFLAPVDPVAQGAPNYFDYIKEPMDLGTMQQKLNEGQYYSAEEFEADMRLIFRNCYTFNPEGQLVNELGHKLEALFDKRWLEKPQPAPTPPPMEESDSSDYDEEYDEAGLTNPAIKVLEDQLTMMKQQLRVLKREALREWRERRGKKKGGGRQGAHGHGHGPGSGGAHSGGSTGAGRRRGSVSNPQTSERRSKSAKNADSLPLHITYEMKKELSEKIQTLPEKKIRKVLAIIQESMPQLKNSNQDEIELEMDQLNPNTLRQLYNYVVRKQEDGTPELKPPAGAGAMTHKKKKSKPLTEDEQIRQIEEIQNKLRQFDQVKDGGSVGTASAAAAAASAASNGAALPADEDSSSDDGANGTQFSDDSSSEED